MSDYIPFASALRKLLASEDRRRRFEDPSTSGEMTKDLGITEAMAGELRRVLADIDRPVAVPEAAEAAAAGLRRRTEESMDGTQEFLDDSFRQLRRTLFISQTMSVLLFGMGLLFLLIAAYRAVWVPGGVGTTAVVAGVGIVQIVALFYRNPLRDIGRAVSNAQQSKMVLMTYMLGVSLIGEDVYHGTPTADAGRRLREMTDDLVALLERYAEDRPPPGAGDED